MAKKRGNFSREFKLEAVAMVTESSVRVDQSARNLDVSESALWR